MTQEEEKLVKKMIDSAMSNFDFEKVRKAMLAVGWRMMQEDGAMRIPTIYQLIKQAEQCLRVCAKHYREKESHCSQIGGFQAHLYDDVLTLDFVLCKSTAFEDDLTK